MCHGLEYARIHDYLKGCLIITGESLRLASCEAGLAMAEGGCGARPLELDAVRDGEDSEATAAAIEGDEAIVALGESCECVVAIIWVTTTMHFLLPSLSIEMANFIR